ncbi:MAG: hypothetical protein LQ342_001580 [Letrouitia transgressa]|nr:MAG: hypothetical protein LQ342_001580 [Letrouitia transgressa]
MGSRDIPVESGNDDIDVLVTGFVPVHYEAVRELVPKLLFPDGSTGNIPIVPQNNTSTSPLPRRNPTTITGKPIDKPRYDIVLHIGMAPGRKYFTLEKRAHRNGYNAKDEDGDSLEYDTWFRDEFNAPELLTPGFDTDDLWRRWKSELLQEDVRPSNDAGRFLCEFLYYTSLVEYWRRDPSLRRPVMFLHVPGRIEDIDIATGRKVTMGLIGAMVESLKGADTGGVAP